MAKGLIELLRVDSSALQQLQNLGHATGPWAPLIDVAFFLASSMLIIWRLEAMSARGVEGTILGTLFMPYFSGLGNLLFVYVILRNAGPGSEVMVNCVVNNATNLTLILGLCGLCWPLSLFARKTRASKGAGKPKALVLDKGARLRRLSLIFTMLAMLFFCGITWALAQDGVLNRGEGLTLIALFLFWQAFHVFEVLKENVRSGSSWHPLIVFDIIIIAASSLVLYFSVEWLVNWLLSVQSGFISGAHLGLITGWLMVLPNALVAIYYAWKQRAEVVYTSQFGDAHICIPLCLGLYAAFNPMPITANAGAGLIFIGVTCLVHLVAIGGFSHLNRWLAGGLVASYAGYLIWLA